MMELADIHSIIEERYDRPRRFVNLELAGRTAIVTGASAGIGAGIARLLAREGAAVAATARDKDRLQLLSTLIHADGHARLALIEVDVTDDGGIERIAHEATACFGPVDILVNCAGASTPATFDSADEIWDKAFALNFTPLRKLTAAVLPAMRQRGYGRVINITGSNEPRTLNASGAAKAAVHMWAKGLAADFARNGVTINNVMPGRINSKQICERVNPTEASRKDFIENNIPAGYFGEPEDVATLVAFLASPRARYITGTSIPVDGGLNHQAF